MSDKSFVTLEQRICHVCGTAYDTGNLLMDTRIVKGKLRETFDHHTTTGFGLCPEHQELFKQGYVALVEATGCHHGDTLKHEEANRTGTIAHLRREVFRHVFNATVPDDCPMVYVEPGVIEKLQEMQEREEG